MNEPTNRSRNVLTLSQRVKVIREYDSRTPKPKIPPLAHKYNVSYLQMKNIILNRESILKSYDDELVRKRQEKIEFLGKVMFEYVQRIIHLNLEVDDDKVLQKAIEVKESIAVANFEPTLSWLNDFKKTYGIPSFDLLKTLRDTNVTTKDQKRTQLTVLDLIAHVSSQEKKKQLKGTYGSGNKPKTGLTSSSTPPTSSPPPTSLPPPLFYNNNKQPKIVYEQNSDDDDIEVKPIVVDITCSPPCSPEDTRQVSEGNKRHCTNNSMGEIESLEEALKHLRLLEEYAMLQDNYRAIGLLTQLEEVLKKPSKNVKT